MHVFRTFALLVSFTKMLVVVVTVVVAVVSIRVCDGRMYPV